MSKNTHGESGEGWYGFDLDGTLAIDDGWKGIDHIGEPVPNMVRLARLLHDAGKIVKVFTARAAPRQDPSESVLDGRTTVEYVQDWCRRNLGFVPEITCIKDGSMRWLFDDHVVGVERNTGRLVGELPDDVTEIMAEAEDAAPFNSGAFVEYLASEKQHPETV